MSETPLADREHHDAQRHADAMQRHRADVLDSIARLEQTQDELLDRLMASRADPLRQPRKDATVTTRVVIAEDEAIIRLDLKETLEEEGYEVVGETGPRRRSRASSSVTSPPTSPSSTSRCRASTAWRPPARSRADRRAAVLILTAFSQRDLIEQARDAGALAYLVKPFQRSELIPAVEVALGRFREMQALFDQNSSLEEQLETRKVVDRAKGLLMDDARPQRGGRLLLDPEAGHAGSPHDAGCGRAT